LHVEGTSLTNTFRVTDATNYTIVMGYEGTGNIGMMSTLGGTAKLALGTNSTARLTIDGSGNVGIGTTTINGNGTVLALYHSADAQIRLQSANTGQTASDGALISLASDNSMYVYNYENTPLIFGTNNTERMRITSGGGIQISTNNVALVQSNAAGTGTIGLLRLGSDDKIQIGDGGTVNPSVIYFPNGNVGIGTTSPDLYSFGGALLTLSSSSTYANLIIASSSTNSAGISLGNQTIRRAEIEAADGSNLIFKTNATNSGATQTERMRITSGGNVGIGTQSPDTYSYGGTRKFLTLTATATNEEPFLQLIANGTGNSIIDFGNSTIRRATIIGLDGSHLAFYTNGSNSSTTVTERMRITSGGSLLIGKTARAFGTAGIDFQSNGADCHWTATSSSLVAFNRLSTDGTLIEFAQDGTVEGTISISGNTTSYNTSSDYRLKQDLKDFNGLSLVNQINVYDYQWKSDSTRSYGVMAHELQSVLPYAVTGVKDGEKMQGVDYSKIVPILIKSIQELKAEIDILKNK
jgi:hypothetical protein